MFNNKYLVIIVALIVGIFIGVKVQVFFNELFPSENESKLSQILNLTTEYYFEDVDTTKMVEAAINGMFEQLDPHTTYLPIEDEKISEESFRGEFDGIGVEFQIIKDTITVVSPISGGPSQKAGIQSGDKIVKIEGETSIGFSNKEVMKSLRGARGSEVNFTIYRSTNRKEYEYSLIRDKIPIYAVDVSLLYNNEIGYVNLSRFSETSTIEVSEALEKLKSNGMKNIVLDLRNNPGGILSEAVSISDLFLDESKLVVYTNGRIPLFDAEYFADNIDGYENYPLIILVNRGSASASEIVAGAIQDWDRGLLVGETTFGKGLVQRPFLLSDGSAVRITVSRYFTPSGRAIQRDYSNGKDEYYSTLYSDPDSNRTDSTKLEYTTKGGRRVFGGGGITPDKLVSYDNLTNYAVELTRNNIYYQFVRRYLDSNKERLTKKFQTINKFNSEFNLLDQKNEFVKFASDNKVKFNKIDFQTDKKYIFQRLKAYIARELWGNEGWYSVMLKSDKQFQTAVTLFDSELKANKVDINE